MVVLPFSELFGFVPGLIAVDDDATFPAQPNAVFNRLALIRPLRRLVAGAQLGGRMNMCGMAARQGFGRVGRRPGGEL